MKRIVGLAIAVALGIAQGQQFPSAIATDLPAAADNAVATLATSIDSSTSVVTFTTASSFAANVPFKIDDEQIKCLVFSGVQMSACTRGYSGTTPAAHSSSGASCASAPYPGCARGIVVAAHVNAIRSEVIAMQQFSGVGGVNTVRAFPTGQIEDQRVVYGTGAGTAGAETTFRYDSLSDRLCIGCTTWDSVDQKLRILGTGNATLAIRAGAGSNYANLDLQSGAGGSTNDNATLTLWNSTTAKWIVAGVYAGNNSFRIIDAGDTNATRFIIDPTTHLMTLQPTAYSVNIIGNVAGSATATGIVNFSSAASTSPCKSGTTAPGTCTINECYFDTDATAGENLLLCTATNTWTSIVGSGGATESGYTASFSSQDPLTILSATHELTECPAFVSIWSVSGSVVTYSPSYSSVSCNTSTLTVTVDFPASTTGIVHLMPTGSGGSGGGGSAFITMGAPASSTAACTTGTMRADALGYLYVCIITDTWVRALLTTW